MRQFLLILSICSLPLSSFCDECCDVFKAEEKDESHKNELKELVKKMKSDRAVIAERVKKMKLLLKEKGWSKNLKKIEEPQKEIS